MKQKYNNKSIYFKDWTSNRLKKEARELDWSIHEMDCYGTRDLRTLDSILNEIQKRGIKVNHRLVFR